MTGCVPLAQCEQDTAARAERLRAEIDSLSAHLRDVEQELEQLAISAGGSGPLLCSQRPDGGWWEFVGHTPLTTLLKGPDPRLPGLGPYRASGIS